ncbi:SMP-30/gluconolactonase/LRE family protein [Gilvimarinus agarilyticus]|uniref:virginiamycin B lyase family protein n=1 Tax=Gilvimarinus sp. 2_MG-2023 TaxID=3062666 RepID=UPI001C08A1A4|nr:SMP-30/gluconolactonase/LRE family protein [Gilvimarinus sp. 2_MG-2023]MBU2886145.1 SMP-30/gluconolactonase/LRE family protein [Gilvimarinus agarilyticus]MDO6570855.1 SMP-30/gluconolactonase/LRE family protein [Gilvimarinus sp. 2_MG-2023]
MNFFNVRIAGLVCFLAAGSASVLAASLPDGEGRDLVEAMCSGCHGADKITHSLGYTRDGWLRLTGTMIDLSADPERRGAIADYLAKHFPPNEQRAPTLVEGDTEISFHEWVVPTLGQRSRDPVQAPNGTIWWVGQWGDIVGKIDPATGQMHEYDLPAGTKPHSVTIDSDGGVWVMGNKNATVVLLDPDSGDMKTYPMPDPDARDPHTGVFDAKGQLWFTLQHSNMVGHLNPATGDIRLATMPTPNSRPYGIKIDASGAPWVACNGSNCLVKVDPKTMALTEIKLPHEDTRVRRLDIAEDGMIWYVNSGRGRLGRYNPASEGITEWPSPSGPKSHPYALAVLDGVVWYNESGMRPDPLVRFDPASETFQSWPIPTADIYAGIVRHMRPTREGDMLIHQSATNRIIRVDIGD